MSVPASSQPPPPASPNPQPPPSALGPVQLGTQPAPSPKPKSRTTLFVVVGVVVAAVVILGTLAAVGAFSAKKTSSASVPPARFAEVQYIVIYSSDNVCDLQLNPGAPIKYFVYTAYFSPRQSFELESVPNFNTTSCIVRAVTTNTTGFSVTSAQVPLAIPGDGDADMNLTVALPATPFQGNLNLVFL